MKVTKSLRFEMNDRTDLKVCFDDEGKTVCLLQDEDRIYLNREDALLIFTTLSTWAEEHD